MGGMSADSWIKLAGMASSVLGANADRNAQSDMMKRLQTTLGGNVLNGPGGSTAFSNDAGAGVDLGMLSKLFGQQAGFAGSASDMASGALNGGVPGNVQQYGNMLDNQNLDLGSFLRTQGGASGLAGMSLMDAFNPNRTAQQIGQQQLDLMRQQARPAEQQAMQDFSQNLYSTGRGAVTGVAGNEGSIGGGRLAAAFGQGLGNADLQRQIAAQAQGQSAATNQEDLLKSAFGRFGDMSNLSNTANTSIFNRQRGVMTDAYGRAVGQATMPASIAAAFQNLTNSGESGALNIGDYGNSLMAAALQNSQAGASARTGSGGNMVSYMSGRSETPLLDVFGKLAAGMSQPSTTNWFQNLISGSKNTQPVPSDSPTGTW
jgi:hypothetical protein